MRSRDIPINEVLDPAMVQQVFFVCDDVTYEYDDVTYEDDEVLDPAMVQQVFFCVCVFMSCVCVCMFFCFKEWCCMCVEDTFFGPKP